MEVRRGWLLAVIAANLVALVALAFIYPHLMVSPGALVAGHTELATDCFACHSPWRGAAPDRCATCHRSVDIGVRTTKGLPLTQRQLKTSFHQDLMELDCMACHSDHQGPRLTQRSRKPFSHGLLRTAVRERCDHCHVKPVDKLHRNLTGGCAQCHKTQAWKPATFEHGEHFVLDRDHDVKCVTCHVNEDYKRYSCYGCHEHTLQSIRAEHEEEGIAAYENCVECHRSADEEPRKKRERDGRDKTPREREKAH